MMLLALRQVRGCRATMHGDFFRAVPALGSAFWGEMFLVGGHTEP